MNNYYSPYKICFHQDKIKQIKSNIQNVIPVQLMLSITNKCNFNCKYCHNKIFFTRNDEELNFKIVKEVIDDCADMGIKVIHLTGGGEPSIHPNFKEIVNYIGKKGLRMGLVTNGTELKLLNKEFEYFDWIRISIDAHNKQSFEKYHKYNRDFNINDLFYNNLSYARKIKEISKKTIVGFSYIITKDNYSFIEEVVFIAKCRQFDNIRLTPVHTKIKDYFSEKLITKVQNIILNCKEEHQDYKFKIFAQTDRFNYLETDGIKSFKECHYQDIVAFVGADGKLPPCCELQKQHNISNKTVNIEIIKYHNFDKNKFNDIYR